MRRRVLVVDDEPDIRDLLTMLFEDDSRCAVVAAVPLPVNVMLWPGVPTYAELADAGVARISQGGTLFLATAGYLRQAATRFLEGEPSAFAGDVPPAFNLIPGFVYR